MGTSILNFHACSSAVFPELPGSGQPGTVVCQIFLFIRNLGRDEEVLLQIEMKLNTSFVKYADPFFVLVT